MNLLAIDTSTTVASVALCVEGQLYHAQEHAQKEHAQKLLPMVDALLHEAGASFHGLEGIAFGCGPGSFTGLRIACSVAKGLAYANRLPVYPVTSLHAIAYKARQAGASFPILSAMDARMKQVYWAYWEEEGQQHAKLYVSCMSEIDMPHPKPMVLAGYALSDYRSLLPASLHALIHTELELIPDAQTLLALVQEGHIQAVSAADAVPVYVRNHVIQGAPHG